MGYENCYYRMTWETPYDSTHSQGDAHGRALTRGNSCLDINGAVALSMLVPSFVGTVLRLRVAMSMTVSSMVMAMVFM
jgi:hypothetical protein